MECAVNKKIMGLAVLALFGTSVAFAQDDGGFNREYDFSDVDTNGDGKISVDEAKANPDMVNEAMYHTYTKARGGVHSDNWDMPLTQQEWDGLTNR